jgi:16S rRNA (guanine966-N2)-methyltransferase
MRVIGGAHRGRRLVAPRGTATRPTLGRVREALFDILGPGVRDSRVLDLFAGTGAVGIEALSRGAARVVFVERDRAALGALRRNLAALATPRERARVVAGEALAVLPWLARTEGAFDLVFVDPPYAGNLGARALAALVASAVLRPGARVIVQHSPRAPVPVVAGLVVERAPRRFGDTALTFLEAEEYTPPGSGP